MIMTVDRSQVEDFSINLMLTFFADLKKTELSMTKK